MDLWQGRCRAAQHGHRQWSIPHGERPGDTVGSLPPPLTAQGTNELVTEFITEFHAVPYGKKCQPLFIVLLLSALFSPI